MIRINLLKAEQKEIPKTKSDSSAEKIKKRIRAPSSSLIFVFLLILSAILFVQQRNAMNRENSILRSAKEEKEKLQNVLVLLDQLEQQKAVFERKINLISRLKSNQQAPVIILDEISKYLPDWVWLTEATFNQQTLFLKGKALSNNLIADYTSRLEDSPFFTNMNFISSTQKKQQNTQYFEFSLTTRYIPPSAPEKAGGQPAKSENK